MLPKSPHKFIQKTPGDVVKEPTTSAHKWHRRLNRINGQLQGR